MCELLALSSSQPVQLTFSLQRLAARGGLDGRAHDGWGVAFYQGPDAALIRADHLSIATRFDEEALGSGVDRPKRHRRPFLPL